MLVLRAPLDTALSAPNGSLRVDSNPPWSQFFAQLASDSNLVRNSGIHTIESFGAKGDGITLDDAAFKTAVESGETILLRNGRSYLLSTRLKPVSGTALICPGNATLVCKTGPGGYAVKSYVGNRTDADRCLFWLDDLDGFLMEGVTMRPDGDTEVTIWPIYVTEGSANYPIVLRRITLEGFSVGRMVDLNSIGPAGYLLENITVRNCGTAEGISYWSGETFMQLTGISVDDDSGGIDSAPGFMSNIRILDLLFSGQALTDYGHQTDGITISAPLGSTERVGPQIFGLYVDGVGEGLDIFGSHCVVKGGRIRRAHYYGVKLIHGAQFNTIELDAVESFGVYAVGLFGSDQTTDHTKNNLVRIGTVTGGGTITGTGAPPAIVGIGDNSGGPATCLPKNNMVFVGNAFGNGTDLDYIVYDGCADNDNANLVEVSKASGWAVTFSLGNKDNVRVRSKDSTEVILLVTADQTLTTATPTTVDFSTVSLDRHGEAVTGSDKVRCKFPGRKKVHAQIRVTGVSSGDQVDLSILVNGAAVRTSTRFAIGSGETYSISHVLYIGESDVSAAAADIAIEATITTAGTPVIKADSAKTYFEVDDLV